MSKYLQDRELNSVLENYFNDDQNQDTIIESENMIKIQEGVYYDVLNEKAKFNFAMKFKDDEQTKELWKVAKEAEDFLNKNGIETSADAQKGWNIAFKVLRILGNTGEIVGIGQSIAITIDNARLAAALGAALGAGAGVTAAPIIIGGILGIIIGYLIRRLIDWGFRHGQGEMSKNNAKKVKANLVKMKQNCKDKKAKDRIDDYIKKIDDCLEKYEKN